MSYYNNEQEGTPSQRFIKKLMNARKGEQHFVSAVDENRFGMGENYIRTAIHFNPDLKGLISIKVVKDAGNNRLGYKAERLK